MTTGFTDLELKAREVLAQRNGDFASQVAVANVFRAMWSSSLPLDQIIAISNAMHRTDLEGTIAVACKAMVKAGILRSRMSKGVRLYEVAI